MFFYTLDRANSLSKDHIIMLDIFNDITPREFQDHINILFPEGVSRHGDWHFLNSKASAIGINENIELIFEYVRRAYFSDKPSRFQSFFAFDSKEDTLEFQSKYGNGLNFPIWKVKCENFFKCDMKLLHLKGSNLAISYNAHLYWLGKTNSEDPLWEYLLIPPVNIIEKI